MRARYKTFRRAYTQWLMAFGTLSRLLSSSIFNANGNRLWNNCFNGILEGINSSVFPLMGFFIISFYWLDRWLNKIKMKNYFLLASNLLTPNIIVPCRCSSTNDYYRLWFSLYRTLGVILSVNIGYGSLIIMSFEWNSLVPLSQSNHLPQSTTHHINIFQQTNGLWFSCST